MRTNATVYYIQETSDRSEHLQGAGELSPINSTNLLTCSMNIIATTSRIRLK